MSDFINASICVSDIPKERVHINEKGKKYIGVCISRLREVDRYGNTHSVYMQQDKEERTAKADRIYIGRGKEFNFQPQVTPSAEAVGQMPIANQVDDLPF